MSACSDSLIAVLEDDGKLHWSDGDIWERVNFDGHWTGGLISEGFLTRGCGTRNAIEVITPKRFSILLNDSLFVEVVGEEAVLEEDGKLHWSDGKVWERAGIDGTWTHGSISGTTLTFNDGTQDTISIITSKQFSMHHSIDLPRQSFEEDRRSVDSASSASETILTTQFSSPNYCFEDIGNPQTQVALNDLEVFLTDACRSEAPAKEENGECKIITCESHEEAPAGITSREEASVFDPQLARPENVIEYMPSGGFFDFDSLEDDFARCIDCLVPPEGYVIVPMGQLCPTAFFLHHCGWRKKTFPLDWSCTTYKVWHHMLADDFQTLLRVPRLCKSYKDHPYNAFQDTLLFLHQKDWAKEGETRAALRRRTESLRGILKDGRGFGFSIYFSGAENVHATFPEVVGDALKLSEGHGFFHMVLIWFEATQDRQPAGDWITYSRTFSALRYRPWKKIGWGEELHAKDIDVIADLLSARFPHIFQEARDCNVDSCEEDADMHEGANENWHELWDFDQGRLRTKSACVSVSLSTNVYD